MASQDEFPILVKPLSLEVQPGELWVFRPVLVHLFQEEDEQPQRHERMMTFGHLAQIVAALPADQRAVLDAHAAAEPTDEEVWRVAVAMGEVDVKHELSGERWDWEVMARAAIAALRGGKP